MCVFRVKSNTDFFAHTVVHIFDIQITLLNQIKIDQSSQPTSILASIL